MRRSVSRVLQNQQETCVLTAKSSALSLFDLASACLGVVRRRAGGSQAEGSRLPGARNRRRLGVNRQQSGGCRLKLQRKEANRFVTGATPFLTIALASGLAGPASAASFSWLNDPNSTVDFSGGMASCGTPALGACGNSYSVTGLLAENLGSAEADVGLFLPFAWPRDESQSPVRQFIAWNNGLGGWYSANFDNLGTSLLLTVNITTPSNIPNTTVLAGLVADSTGVAIFGPSSDSPNVGFPNSSIPFRDTGPYRRAALHRPRQLRRKRNEAVRRRVHLHLRRRPFVRPRHCRLPHIVRRVHACSQYDLAGTLDLGHDASGLCRALVHDRAARCVTDG